MSDVFTLPVRSRRTVSNPRPLGHAQVLDGTTLTSVDLEPTIFGIEPNMAVLHQV